MILSFIQIIREFNRDVKLCLLATALFGFSLFGGVMSLLLNLYLLRMGYGTKFVGLVNATGALTFAVCGLPSGILGARWGSRFIMITGMFVLVSGFGLLSQAELIPSFVRKGYILGSYSLCLLGVALYLVNTTPFLMEITSSEDRIHVFSVQAALMPLSGFAGSLTGGILVSQLATILDISPNHPSVYRFTLSVSALLLIPGAVALLATQGKATEREEWEVSEEVPLPVTLIVFIALIALFHISGEGAVRTFFNVYLDEVLNVPVSLIGTLIAAAQLLGVPAALTMPALSSRFGKYRIVIMSTVGITVILIPLALISHWAVAGICYMGVLALTSIRRPAFLVLSQELVPPRWRTAVSGASSMMSGLGYSSMSMIGGYVILDAGYPSLFMMGAGLTGLGTVIFWAYFRRVLG